MKNKSTLLVFAVLFTELLIFQGLAQDFNQVMLAFSMGMIFVIMNFAWENKREINKRIGENLRWFKIEALLGLIVSLTICVWGPIAIVTSQIEVHFFWGLVATVIWTYLIKFSMSAYLYIRYVLYSGTEDAEKVIRRFGIWLHVAQSIQIMITAFCFYGAISFIYHMNIL